MGVYAGVTDDYLTQSDQTRVADSVEKYRLWSLSKEGDPGRTPALDLNFAENKSLVDDVSGNNLITFTRSSVATYVDTDGLISIASTDTPRFDHDPTTGESLGLLVEESRVTYNTYTEDPTQWNTTNMVATGNSVTLPTGEVSTTIEYKGETTDANNKFIRPTVSGSAITAGDTWTYSGFYKKGVTNGERYVFITLQNNTASEGTGRLFDFDTGTWQSSQNLNSVTDVDSGYEEYPNGWYRIWMSCTFPSASGAVQTFTRLNANSTSIPYDTSFSLWGAQLEKASFMTSYIPNDTGSTKTRNADNVTITGTNFSDWYNQDEGTVYVSQKLKAVQDTSRNNLVYLINGGANNDYFYNTNIGNQHIFVFGDGGTNYSRFAESADSTDSKIAWAYDVSGDDFKPYYNGIEATTETNSNTPSATSHNQLELGATAGAKYSGNIKRLTYWPQRLQNSTLQSITE
jgi:hypothetical protein